MSGPTRTARLVSLDALRGFDMMWIVGADALGGAFRQLHGGAVSRILGEQLEHSPWAGFTLYDLIFPLFIFMIGVSLTFSLGRVVAQEGRHGALRRVFKRAVLMFALGLIFYGGLSHGLDQMRVMGVLQRLALCYFFASLLYIYVPLRGRIAVCAGSRPAASALSALFRSHCLCVAA